MGRKARVVKDNRRKVMRQAEQVLDQFFEWGGKEVKKNARRNIRNHDLIDTKYMLNRSWHIRISKNQVEIATDAEYAKYHEYGTYKMIARPFMGPALNEVEGKTARRLKFLWKKVVEKQAAVGGGE